MKNVKNNYYIGVTGNIGTGKSTFINIVLNMGFNVFESDKYVHELLSENISVKEDIFEKFGTEVFTGEEIDRRKLGKVIFNNKEKKEILNKIIHPKVIDEIKCLSGLWFVEVPLLFEASMENMFNEIVLIYSPEEQSIDRVIKRNNFSYDYAKSIYESQTDIEEKKELSNFIINNISTLDEYVSNINKYLEGFNERIK